MKPLQKIAGRVRKHCKSVRAREGGTTTRTVAGGALASIRVHEVVAVITITNKEGRKATTTCAPEQVEVVLAKLVQRLSNWL